MEKTSAANRAYAKGSRGPRERTRTYGHVPLLKRIGLYLWIGFMKPEPPPLSSSKQTSRRN
jgi:hypothetical protein